MARRLAKSLCAELLGPPRAWIDGEEVTLGPPMQQAVFAALAARCGRPVSRTELLADLWGSARPHSAEGNLHTYVAGLRRALEPDRSARQPASLLSSENGGYVLRIDEAKLDLAIFERYRAQAEARKADGDLVGASSQLEAALGLWRGQAMAGLPGPFAELSRVRLAEQRLLATEERAELLLELGQVPTAVAELAVVVREQPLREHARALLMLALFRAGRQADALASFRDGQHLLAAELGVEPGQELRETHARILAETPLLVSRHPAQPAPIPRPAQLPCGIRDFAARHQELALLRAWVDDAPDDSPPLIVLHGVGGVGKTALATRFAAEMAGRFPDGQMYVHLRGYDPAQPPLSTAEILAQLLRGLRVEMQAVPVCLEERAEALRQAVSGKRLLIFLDDAASPVQLCPVLPALRGTLVLMTTRRRMSELADTPGIRRLSVPALERHDSVELLQTVLGAEPDPLLDRLAAACGDLPLALRVAAERITSRALFDPAQLVDELATERFRLDVLDSGDDDATALRAVFSWSYRALGPERARSFRLLGLHPAVQFSTPAAAALLDVSVTTARRLLDSLANEHLLERVGESDFRFHDLVWLYAADRAGEEETAATRDRVRTRLITWYLRTMDAAAAVLNPHRPRIRLTEPKEDCGRLSFADRNAALAWCECQRLNILAVIDHAAELGEHRLAWELARSSWAFFHLRSHWSDWSAAASTALRSARALQDPSAEAAALVDLATPLQHSGELAAAEEDLRSALAIYQTLRDSAGLARAANNLSLVLCDRGEAGTALEYAQFALATFSEVGNGWAQANALGNLGWCYSLEGRHHDAIDHFVRSLVQCRRHDYEWGESFALRGLGTAHGALRNFEAAKSCFAQSLDLCRAAGDRRGSGMALESLGEVAALRGELDEARSRWEAAIAILAEANDPYAERIRARLAAFK
ncbi:MULTISPECIES: AfsR/SARP family transcriptional regulator [Amycolatopsis]|uniref:BTAD domain-containing putative transcriptional regulator n=1 Tax=Amycolatopsis albidoflavus TaxID=102226 RepID=A0ABW5I882_9PSEU